MQNLVKISKEFPMQSLDNRSVNTHTAGQRVYQMHWIDNKAILYDLIYHSYCVQLLFDSSYV